MFSRCDAFNAKGYQKQNANATTKKYIETVEPPLKRTMQDYYRRVASKLAAAEKERNEAGGADVGLKSDEDEDLREIMSIGKVDLEGWMSQE